MKTLICIDPGKSGGLVRKSDGQPLLAVPMPATEGDVVALLRQWVTDPAATVAVIEEVSGYAGVGQPGSRMFTFGRGFGFLLGVLQTMGVRIELVRPQKWQKALGLGCAADCASASAWKNKLKAHAQRLYPEVKVTLAVSDALLLLEYALRNTR